MGTFFDSSDMLKKIYSWRKRLLIVLVGSICASVIISFIITPRYRSEAIIYPSNLGQYSDEAPSEQLLQFLVSDEMMDKLINSMDLNNHYDLKTGTPRSRMLVKKLLRENLKIRKTEYGSINMKCVDTDPQVASNLLDTLISLVHKKIHLTHMVELGKRIFSAKEELELKSIEMDSITKRLDYFRDNFGIINYGVQTEEVYEVYYAIKGAPKVGSKEIDEVTKLVEDIKLNGNEQNKYSVLGNAALEDFIGLKRHYEKLLEESRFERVYVNVVSAPHPAEVRYYPVRWLIVLSITISSLFLAILISFIKDYDK